MMATLIALVYPDVTIAEEAAATARGLERDGYLDIFDSSLVTKDEDGRFEQHRGRHSLRAGAIGGAVLGALTGLIFTIPVFGLAAGAATGGLLGELAESEFPDGFEEFRDQVSTDLQPGGAALLIFGATENPDHVMNELGRHGGTIRSTDLSDQRLATLQAEINKVSASQQ
jgi:uncharacterized membrane protein